MMNEVTEVQTTQKLILKDDSISLDWTVTHNHTLDLLLFILTLSQPFYSILIDLTLSGFFIVFFKLKAKTELGWGGSTHKLLTMVRKGKGQEPPKGDVMIWYEQYVAMGLDKTPFDSTEDDAIVNSLNRVA